MSGGRNVPSEISYKKLAIRFWLLARCWLLHCCRCAYCCVCLCLLLPTDACCCLLLPAAACGCLLPAAACCSLLLPAAGAAAGGCCCCGAAVVLLQSNSTAAAAAVVRNKSQKYYSLARSPLRLPGSADFHMYISTFYMPRSEPGTLLHKECGDMGVETLRALGLQRAGLET